MEPGDALFIHPRTLHFSTGNRTRQRRLAYATWWYGDDVVWDPRPECEDPAPGVDTSTMRRGGRPAGDAIPVVWRAAAPVREAASARPVIS
jgi:ectoine hydroxylase-related dioxygenase (phytanoyl-CoA dioxygenase family)